MQKKRVVVFASSFLDELKTAPPETRKGEELLANLAEDRGRAVEVEFRCDRNPRTAPTVDELNGVTAVIADLEPYSRDLLESVGTGRGGKLELIVRYGVGLDSVDVDAATDAGIVVANTPGANSTPTAEWAVATLMDIAGRRVPHQERAAKGLAKTGPSRLDVSERTLGIVGTGAIGRTVAELLRGFDMSILAHDPYPNDQWADTIGASYVPLDELCAKSDFITLHAAASQPIIGERELALVRPTTVLINCARGILVDNRAAYQAVKSGRLFGYGLDEIWPEADLPLGGLNIAVSPHVGSDTDRGKARMQLLSAKAVAEYFSGAVPTNAVNPSAMTNR